MNWLRHNLILFILGSGLVCVQSEASFKTGCESFLNKVVAYTQSVINPIKETPFSDISDYDAVTFDKLSLSERYVYTYKRIQNRHHQSYRTMFFYDYEVRDVIEHMKTVLLDAREFSLLTPEGLVHGRLLKSLKQEIERFESLQQIPYFEFHQTTLNFASFIKKGLKNQVAFRMKPQGRYSNEGYKFTTEMIRGRLNTTGPFDVDHETPWVILREKLLRQGPRGVFIPTFEELSEDFFNAISSYPVFPAGLTADPNIIVDGQLYGSVLFLLHDFYHADKSLGSIDYTAEAIAAREHRRQAFNVAVAQVQDPMLNRIIRILYLFINHEEKSLSFKKGTIVLSHSKQIVSALNLDGEMFEEIQMRFYGRPYDFGELFGDKAPTSSELFKARDWIVSFFKNDTYYP